METHQLAERVGFAYRSGTGDASHDVELPFRVLVLGAFTERTEEFNNERPISVTADNFSQVIRSLKISLRLRVPNRLSDGAEDEALDVALRISSMADFEPEQVLIQVPELLELNGTRELVRYLRDAGRDSETIRLHLSQLRDPQRAIGRLEASGIDLEGDEIDRDLLGHLLVEIDRRVNAQLDEIIHHRRFGCLESAWRSLLFLVERTDFEENCSVELLSVGKDALVADFEDVPEIRHSRLHDIVYGSEFGQFGGRPYGVMIGDYEFGPGSRDLKLAQNLAAIARMSHAPFVAGADHTMFDVDAFAELSRLRDLDAIFGQEKFAKWNSFRNSEDSRYFALTLPRFRLRRAYGVDSPETNGFVYSENVFGGVSYGAWGNSAFALATRLLDSFARYRWCINIAGEEDGRVEGLHMEQAENAVDGLRIPAQVLISDRQGRELIAHGFMPLIIQKGSDNAAFFSSNSVMATKPLANDHRGKEAALGLHMSGQLQYLFITCRIAHYLKMMQREHIGSWKNKVEVERELNEWLRQYISDMDNPTAAIRARRPLRRARVHVTDLQDRHDWYVIEILVTPHLKYMGVSFTLDETGRLEKQ